MVKKTAARQLSVFLSYAHADKTIARLLARELKKAGLRVWIDEGELRTGDSIISRISSAIREVEYVVALVSERSVFSKWCSKELSLAVNHGLQEGRVRVLPLRLDDVDMPPALQDVKYLQINSTDPTRIVSRLVRDARLHRKELQKQKGGSYTLQVKQLAPTSKFDEKQLKRMGFELTSVRLAERYEAGDDAMKSLMNDYSVPAIETLYQAAVRDSRAKLNLGYGLAGIVYLAPITAAWIRKLLMHRNGRVFSDTLDALAGREHVTYPARLDTFLLIKGMEGWNEFKKQFLSRLRKSWHREEFRSVIMQTEATSKMGR